MSDHLFKFRTTWRVPADLVTVWNRVGQVSQYPKWWPGIREVKVMGIKQSRSYMIAVLALLLLAPTLAQYIGVLFHQYGIGLLARLLIHVLVPVLLMAYVDRLRWRPAFLAPILPDSPQQWRWSLWCGLIVGFIAIVTLLGFFAGFYYLVDHDAIRLSLMEKFRISPVVFPAVALAVLLINPFLEEYFWRGFIYGWFRRYFSPGWQRQSFLIVTGVFFALHHLVIISQWFNWWQFLLCAVFLACVGMLFNWMYERSGSIIASWLTHAIADLVLVLIGFHLFGFF